MDDEEENTEEEGEVRGGDLKCYIQTDIQTYRHTDPPTKRVLEEHSLLKRESEAELKYVQCRKKGILEAILILVK